VVDVAHDGDHGRARDQVLVRVVVLLGLELLLGRALDRDLASELDADDLDLLVRERLRRGPHLTEIHQDLDQLRHLDAERLRKVLDRDSRLDRDGAGRLCGRLWTRGRRP
jgi:hypothetical protein